MADRLTPAQQHLQRVRDRVQGSSSPLAATTAPETAAPAEPPPTTTGSPARQAMLRKAALLVGGAPAAANDNDAVATQDDASAGGGRAALSAHHQLLLQLEAHMRQLGDTKSIERKIALKREFLPEYSAWILGALEAGSAEPDPILTQGMIWAVDVGDYSLGLELAEHHVRHRLPMPERFKSDVQTWATDSIADAAIKALAPPEGLFPHGVLGRVEILIEGHDMPDQARAKLQKALGLECAHLADNPPEGHAVAGWRPSQLTAALACYRRALELDPAVGVKKAIEVLERELKKEPT